MDLIRRASGREPVNVHRAVMAARALGFATLQRTHFLDDGNALAFTVEQKKNSGL
jgi:hypothetical protein